jgi:DNA (cytosine-5)-methyltransferase 1
MLEIMAKSKVSNNGKQFKLIDLFCGAGGMTLGFTRFGKDIFKPIWANDFNAYAVKTYRENFGPHCSEGDIVNLLKDPSVKIPLADVVIGGPPCQGFSLLNKNRKADPRKQLWRPFLEVVKRSKARVFVMENVPQLLGSVEFLQIIAEAEKLGFRIAAKKLCAADYGVAQTRWRAFIVGCKSNDPNYFFPPKQTHYNPHKKNKLIAKINDLEHWNDVEKAIGNLLPPIGTEIREANPPLNLHFGRTPTKLSLMRYKAIPKPGMNRFDLQKRAPYLTPACWKRKKTGGTDLFGRLWWDRPAFTIRTEFFKPEKGRYLHPEQHRPITHREAARLQSFPDEFNFLGTKIEIAKQIGNAVPPLLAEKVASCVYDLLTAKKHNYNDRRFQRRIQKQNNVFCTSA